MQQTSCNRDSMAAARQHALVAKQSRGGCTVVTAVTPAPPAFSVLLPMSYFNNFQYLSAMPQLLHVSANF
jgi:hypothetical protein